MPLRPRLAWIAVLCGGLVVLALWQWDRFVTRHYLQQGATQAEATLRLTAHGLSGHLARYEMVPQLLADLDLIRLLATRTADPVQRSRVNTFLVQRNAALNASDIYIMDMTGETIAASNYTRPDSFVGQTFSYRPYFTLAARGDQARFYALGTTSGVRGYYFSAPVRDLAGRISAVIAVKIGLDAVEASWRGSDARIFVTDPEGIVFMSSVPDWLYGGLLPLTEDRLARMREWRRYSDADLHPLDFRTRQADGVTLLTAGGSGGPQEFITVSQAMPEAGWTVHVLLQAGAARAQARIAVVMLVLVLVAAGSAAVLVIQRRARAAERMALQHQAQVDLERRVDERTADLARVNARLEEEITERRATEAELLRTQANLVQAGKLAAVGQMSAALSHEINQPLAAARNYADSAAILIDRGENARAKGNLQHILSLIDRMAAIGRHLRNVARKPNEKLSAVALTPVLAETQIIVAARLAACRAVLEIDVPPDLPPLRAGAVRLQQVLVNLITNAADAVEGAADRRISLTARAVGPGVEIRIRDRGPGVAPAVRDRIFDPFFTTKGPGAGLGLGLSITWNIVKDFGGEIAVLDADPGAEFVIRLHPTEAAEAAA